MSTSNTAIFDPTAPVVTAMNGANRSSPAGTPITIGATSPVTAGYSFQATFSPSVTLSVLGPSVAITATSVGPSNAGPSGGAQYMPNSNATLPPLINLNIPSLNLSVTGLLGDGTVKTLADGSKVSFVTTTLTYTVLGTWGYAPASGGTSYLGSTDLGLAKQIVPNAPKPGSATYNGAANGAYFVPSGTGTIAAGVLAGNMSLTANFSNDTVSGTLTNMIATPVSGGAATPWNTVALSGTIQYATGSAYTFSGPTSTSSAPSGAGNAGFSNAASGHFAGVFNGPNAEEVGGTWTLSDPAAAGGGKTAFGTFGGVR